MRRTHEIRVSEKTAEVVKILRVMSEKKMTKAAMAEKLIWLGVEKLAKTLGWEVPDDLRP